ncbi:hypothetical protein [Amycolatopsis thailandensis]|uniref:hypothetical protein n=1 Tax=Amycolatopsis thailandensis TaxID=589330 RepID=UPI0036305B3E
MFSQPYLSAKGSAKHDLGILAADSSIGYFPRMTEAEAWEAGRGVWRMSTEKIARQKFGYCELPEEQQFIQRACGCGKLPDRDFLPGHDVRAMQDRVRQHFDSSPLKFVKWVDGMLASAGSLGGKDKWAAATSSARSPVRALRPDSHRRWARADLLLAQGDPTKNISDSLSIKDVWRGGIRHAGL